MSVHHVRGGAAPTHAGPSRFRAARLAPLVLLASLVSLAACQGSTDASETRPDVAGVYDVTGSFDTLPLTISGPMTIEQPSTSSGLLTGTIVMTTALRGSPGTPTTYPLVRASLTTRGELTFWIGETFQTPAAYKFFGRLSGGSGSGTFQRLLEADTLYGSWTATRR
jgi:hypothetical protein